MGVSVEPVEEEVIENYGPLEMAKEWAKCRGRFSGKDARPAG